MFDMLKIRTLREGVDKTSSFATSDQYVWGGRFMRKYRIDEIPQIWNLLKGQMNFVGPRPEEERVIELYPEHIREKLLSIKPGWFSLAGIYFFKDEEEILRLSPDPHKDYWEKIRPIKLTLDFFYIDNKGFLLDLWIIYQAIKRGVMQVFKK